MQTDMGPFRPYRASKPKPEDKPFIVWLDYGSEGWSPTSYDTLKEAIEAPKYGSRWIVTKRVEWEAVDKEDG